MLVLTRHPGEQIVIDHPDLPSPIRLVVLSLDTRKVRLGFEAAEEVRILRKEIACDTPKRS